MRSMRMLGQLNAMYRRLGFSQKLVDDSISERARWYVTVDHSGANRADCQADCAPSSCGWTVHVRVDVTRWGVCEL